MEIEIEKILNDGGFETVSGVDAVLGAIKDCAGTDTKPLCSGYGVLPGGDKCAGCKDCWDSKEFEIGKYYKHATGKVMNIVGLVNTTAYGETLVAEEHGESNLKPVGVGKGYSENWEETTEEVWLAGFSR